LLGSWRSTYKILKTALNPEERRGTAESTFAKVLGGKFIQEKRQHSDKTTHLTMYTYDPEHKVYAAWWFSSTGQTAAYEGKWDAEARTMTWTTGEGAVKTIIRYRFVTDDLVDWDVQVKEKDKIIGRMEGKNTRALLR
jgi:hypothetical protein